MCKAKVYAFFTKYFARISRNSTFGNFFFKEKLSCFKQNVQNPNNSGNEPYKFSFYFFAT